ncbi:translation initiation factor IF-2 [Candidatus Micrarchaeota archaeon CG10_big_fil_rev_8_21_14_0_10_54_18]|nr:MAG: translation initiation factor IF-2 [Candidatus Micrarchaeota archaeon CG1_02_55_41]PIO02550.1 MAG: translation initiation factor IF-2 [Candidatus Micrarchaeota archaeon CG09_land_8_20_14_0_10_55_25]PJD01614.1 MAG: translation initiation factor IF-2 [Candidatus Micrarchaeota archaeon CG10_big_fil_rev_8_21_14_0_10_54_18]
MVLRQPIVCVLGHVDHGKTTILDSVRQTKVQSREAGSITQHIGASEVPVEVIQRFCGDMLSRMSIELTIPGLLFIDTPGHEAFANLRKRGGSIADIAVLVIDVNQGIQNQTREAITILKERKTPFVIALNKVDALTGWRSSPNACSDFAAQFPDALQRLDEKIYGLVGELYGDYGINAERFDRVTDFTKQVVMVPCSAKTREGISDLLLFVAGLAQKYLENRLELHAGKAKASILEVREESGLGYTLHVILYDGVLKVGDPIVFAKADGVVESKVKALFKPKPLDEMRDPKQRYSPVKEVFAACGVKVACDGADQALAGSSLFTAGAVARETIEKELKELSFDRKGDGVIVKADALGSLEAITAMLKKRGVPVKAASIGAPSKKDLMEAKAVREREPLRGAMLCFNEKASDEIRRMAEEEGVHLVEEKVIYALVEGYERWVKEQVDKERREAFSNLVLPAKITTLPGCCFRASNPCICGIRVDAGRLKKDVELLNGKGELVGRVRSIQKDKESVDEARKGDELAISIAGPVFGRQLRENQVLYVRIPKKDLKQLEGKYFKALTEEEKELLAETKELQA